MPTVPRGPVAPDMPVPSETDLMMALATMKELGRFKDRLDPSFQGNVEDRRDEDSHAIEAQEAREAATDRMRRQSRAGRGRPIDPMFEAPTETEEAIKRARPRGKEPDLMREFEDMKVKRSREYISSSLGVSGGSR